MRNRVLLGISAFAVLAIACDKPKNDAPASNNASPATPTTQPETRSAQMKGEPTTATKPIEPKDPVKAADADMRKVLEELDALGGKPIATLTPEEARKQPTPADAVAKVLEKEKKSVKPLEIAKIESRKIPGAGGQIDARIYTPKTDSKKPLPVIAYWHGGGFAIANLDTYDASARALADGAQAIVVSLDYRHAPENKFPAAHEDAFAGWQWVTQNAASLGGDPKRIAVAGESAGGNLAANVAIMAHEKGGTQPVHQLLVYPVAQPAMNTKSYQEWANAKPLNKDMMGWFFDKYARTPDDAKDPRIDLTHAKLDGLPKTTIVLAEIDPLHDDGMVLADKLKAAKVDVDTKTYEGVTHEFFGMGAVVSDAKDAEKWAAGRLKDSFEDAAKSEKKAEKK